MIWIIGIIFILIVLFLLFIAGAGKLGSKSDQATEEAYRKRKKGK